MVYVLGGRVCSVFLVPDRRRVGCRCAVGYRAFRGCAAGCFPCAGNVTVIECHPRIAQEIESLRKERDFWRRCFHESMALRNL